MQFTSLCFIGIFIYDYGNISMREWAGWGLVHTVVLLSYHMYTMSIVGNYMAFAFCIILEVILGQSTSICCFYYLLTLSSPDQDYGATANDKFKNI